MKPEKLFQILALVDGVKSRKWETVMQLVDVIARGNAVIQQKKWNDSYKESKPELYPLDLADINTWSTFDGSCIDLYFTNDTTKVNGHPNNQLVCKVKIYDGDPIGGSRLQLRFEALLWLPPSFISTIEQRIIWELDSHLEDAHEKHLEAQKKHWINEMKTEIINS